MFINRYNYEEYFLLYVDDELSLAERQTIEVFVLQNPDLSKEFEILQQAKLLPTEDRIVFAEKGSLHRKEDAGINYHNYEEYFLLYIDDELNTADRKSVETFVLQHPEVQDSFTLLKHTVLEQENVKFKNKSSLYRGKERRTIPLMWLRITAAACIIGIAILAWWLIPSAKNRTIAETNKIIQKASPVNKTDLHAQASQGAKPQTGEFVTVTKNKAQKQLNDTYKASVSSRPGEKQNPADTNNKQNSILVIPNKNIADNNNDAGKMTSFQNNNVAVTKVPPPAIVASVPGEQKNMPPDIIAYQKASTITSANGNFTHAAVYKELDTDDDDRSINVGSMQLNKNKIKGFLKKAGRFFGVKSKAGSNDDGKLQVANMEINTN